MAKNEDDDVAGDGEDGAAALEAAGRKKKVMLLAVVGVVLLLAAGGGTWFALKMLGGDKAAAPAAEGEAPAADEKAAKVEPNQSFYTVFDPAFLANYEVGGRTHYLQVTLAVMTRSDAATSAVTTDMPLLRNRVVMLLSGESFEQLQTDAGRVALQQKLLSAMQEILQKETGKPQIEQVYFTGFVMQ